MYYNKMIIICNKCYEKEINYKKLFLKTKDYICYLCKQNIFFYTNLNIVCKSKEIIFSKKNNNRECCLKKCSKRIEDFEKKSVLICPKCVLENNKLNINNYSVVEPDIMCLMCNFSLCSSYNFHKTCFDSFIQDLKEID